MNRNGLVCNGTWKRALGVYGWILREREGVGDLERSHGLMSSADLLDMHLSLQSQQMNATECRTN